MHIQTSASTSTTLGNCQNEPHLLTSSWPRPDASGRESGSDCEKAKHPLVHVLLGEIVFSSALCKSFGDSHIPKMLSQKCTAQRLDSLSIKGTSKRASETVPIDNYGDRMGGNDLSVSD